MLGMNLSSQYVKSRENRFSPCSYRNEELTVYGLSYHEIRVAHNYAFNPQIMNIQTQMNILHTLV
jgi:hypothetical protein